MFKFSVIIPIYNVEKYLEETIESVVNQTIGFEENIQLILVNDGSPDDSESICLRYQERYPHNVIYVKQENSGVSAAKNNGFGYAQGEYVTFLDSDDKWDLQAFQKAYRFFVKHQNEVDVIACPMEYFDAQVGMQHPLNFKFHGNRVIDITKDCNCIQMSAASCFIRREAVKRPFNLHLKYAEDALLINLIILEKGKYGTIESAHYLYRKRYSGNSAIDSSLSNHTYYHDTLHLFHDELLAYGTQKFGELIPYLQYVLMYDLQWRIKVMASTDVLTEEEIAEYKAHIKALLTQIDDEVILAQRNIANGHKLYALSLKHDGDIFDRWEYRDGNFYFDDRVVYSLSAKESICKLNAINLYRDKMDICGTVNCPLPPEQFSLFYEYDGEIKSLPLHPVHRGIRYGIDCILYTDYTFQIKEPLFKGQKHPVRFFFQYQGQERYPLTLAFTTWSRLARHEFSHYTKNGWLLHKQGKDGVLFRKQSALISLGMEMLFFFKNIFLGKFKNLTFRLVYHLAKLVKRKPIWIVSDRTAVANDNGMHMFKYLTAQKDLHADVYFAIEKHTKDFQEMHQYGKVLAHNSFWCKIMFLLSDKIISSQADECVVNAFGRSNIYYRDLYRFKFVFLQHGVTKDDISSWLNKCNKNINMFVTVAYPEYQSLLSEEYGYDESVVKLTGFPRYDNLKNEGTAEKLVAIMPTWRQALSGVFDHTTGIRAYNPEFKESEYFKFYSALINDDRILDCMKANGYKGIFVIHPSHETNYVDFQQNDVFEIAKGFADYQTIFRTASLLVSDYSSVPFDFAYLYKPVVYTQFDREAFFSDHVYSEGYFDYERDGFGPVTYDYESTVQAIIGYIKNGCQMEPQYVERVDHFYKYHDHNNCERVYKEILALDEQ